MRIPRGIERWARGLAVALGLSAAARGSAEAQILPPIYKPLPVEEGARVRSTADSLRAQAAEIQERADALREGARTLRENGTGVAEKLREQAGQLADEANRFESRADADALTAAAVRAQAAEFARRAEEGERLVRAARHRADSLAAVLASDSARAESALAPDTAAPLDPGLPPTPEAWPPPAAGTDSARRERVRELRAQVRADSQTAVTFRAQSEGLAAQAAALEAAAASTRARAQEVRGQEARLRAYEEEIVSGRTASEGTAARLEEQAGELSRTAARHAADAMAQGVLAEEWRVQAGRTLLPVRSRAEAMRFYGEDGRSVLRNLVFSVASGGGAGTIHGELVSDYAGPVRLGAGLVLAEATRSGDGVEGDSAEVVDRARERFYAGGGNFVLYASLPLAFARSAYHSVTLQTLGKVGLDVPGSRRVAEAGSVPANLDVGMEAYATFNTFGSRFKAFALLRSAYAAGNGAFFENLGRPDLDGLPYLQLTFGTEVASTAKVLLSGAYGSGGLNRRLSLTFQVSPSAK